ncbi:MAG: beta-galactosidase trimerization domain-containing protein [Clostridia bacterium]|nr:beta-galactosidase trimerization domain-containing protein [Clostridia bacterium]
MNAKNLRYRQVHLDFHTSPAIPSVGERFSREQFAQALKRGHVDSITLFSKCHHGYSYHPTKVNTMHPGLKFDLLGEQLAVCKELGVNAPVYISAGLDEKEANLHPEWLCKGTPNAGVDFLGAAYYKLFCYNTPYMDQLEAQIEEVMERYNPIGIFLDISSERDCYCQYCIQSMRKKGLDPHKPEDVRQQARDVYAEYARRCERAVRKYNPDTYIFHNAGNITRGRRDIASFDTHLELESLPTGGWGYDHFPMSAAYVRNLGKEYLGMTGKFHTTWGEFGGFKHPNALRYETALSIALGAKCSIGDQLHPSGEMNLSTYDLIGKAYAEVEEKEIYCRDKIAVSDVAVLSAEAVLHGTRETKPDIGVCRMLLEGKYLFDLIDLETPFDGYKLLVLPDAITVDEALAARLKQYLAAGGKILATGKSGLDASGAEFAIDLGVTYNGKNAYCPTYMVPADGTEMINGQTSYVMYTAAQNVAPTDGTDIFAYLAEPYFNRTPEHFSSHQHTPDVPDSRKPAAVFTENTAYICWNIFEDYAIKGSLCLKELFLYAVERLIGTVKTISVKGLPDRGVVTLTRDADGSKYQLHLLFAHTCVRGINTEVIEDLIDLHNLSVTVRGITPKAVISRPDGTPLPFEQTAEGVRIDVAVLKMHALLEIVCE